MKWIPVNEKLPDEYRLVLISFYDSQDYNGVNVGFLNHGYWYLRLGEDPLKIFINAWMPLPEPYKGE